MKTSYLTIMLRWTTFPVKTSKWVKTYEIFRTMTFMSTNCERAAQAEENQDISFESCVIILTWCLQGLLSAKTYASSLNIFSWVQCICICLEKQFPGPFVSHWLFVHWCQRWFFSTVCSFGIEFAIGFFPPFSLLTLISPLAFFHRFLIRHWIEHWLFFLSIGFGQNNSFCFFGLDSKNEHRRWKGKRI